MQFEIHEDIRQAWTPPSEWYRSEESFRATKERVFARSWQWITDDEPLKAPGSVMPFTLLDGLLNEPLLFTRDRDDTLHCLSNVCTHRGNLVCEGATVANSLRCRYHGRRFGLDGSFQYMPEFEGVSGFPGVTDHLPGAPWGQWANHLFAGVAPIMPLADWIGPMADRVGFLPLTEFRHAPEFGREYLVRGHWALYVDNYLEGFHIPYIHAALNDTLNYGDYSTELFWYGNLQLGIGKEGESCFDLPADHQDFGKNVSAYYFWIFPNLMFNFYPWGLSINVVRPISPDVTKVKFIPYVWRPELRDIGAGGDLDRVEREDEAVIELVQRGIQSRFYNRGRYAPVREMGTHQFHRLLAEFLAD